MVATADIDRGRAQRAAEAFGAQRAVTDYRQIIDDVDAVLLVTPHDLHHRMGMDFLTAGKHVLMEKPMAVSEQQCLDLIHAAQRAGVVLMTAYPTRFHPMVIKVKELIDAEPLGPIFHLSIWTEQHTEPPEGHWIRSADRLGGGQFFSHGCHYVDLMLWMLGRPVRGTHMGTSVGTPWMELEGTSDAMIKFASGVTGYHFGTWGARATRQGYSIQVHCERGLIEANLTTGKLYLHHGWAGRAPRGGLADWIAPDPEQTEPVLVIAPNSKHLGQELVHFIDCLDTGDQPRTDGPGSLQGLRVIWRLYEAERHGVIADLTGLGLDEPWDMVGLGDLPVAREHWAQ